MTKKRYLRLILILGALTALGPFTIDIYLPAFPAMAHDLHTDINTVGLTLSGYFAGLAFGQLLYGPLLDRYGRKRPLYLGLTLYILASLACASASTIEFLVLFRVLQAIGVCAASVAPIAMVRDLFPVTENAKVFALLVLVVGASPMIAPTIGGYVTETLGWQQLFIILAALGSIILLGVVFGLPGTKPPDLEFSLKPAGILKNFAMVMKEPKFYINAACSGVAITGLMVYVAGSPLLFMKVFQVEEKIFGWIFAILSVGLIGGSQLNTLLLKRFSSRHIIQSAMLFQAIVSAILLAGACFEMLEIYSSIILIFLFLCGTGLIMPNATALAMAPFSVNAGSASSLLGAGQMTLGTLSTIALSFFKGDFGLPMICLMAATPMAGMIILSISKRHRQ